MESLVANDTRLAQDVPPKDQTEPASGAGHVVVIGAGPAGLRAAQKLSQAGMDVLVLDRETEEPYNRVKLTPLLAGDVSIGEIRLPADFRGPGRVEMRAASHVARIDPDQRRITLRSGEVIRYLHLIIATGSRPFVPNIPGHTNPGVFVFRNASDVSGLIARSFSARKIVVVGGGLLGLEAARGLARRGVEVTIVEHEERLMPRQLDRRAAARLQEMVERLGITVRTRVRVAEIECGARIKAIWLADGERVECDSVVFCTGVRANSEIAREAGLAVARGIIVDEHMRTSDPHIFAVGECAEFANQVVGLAGPALDQAEIAADAIAGKPQAYENAPQTTKLKLFGADVISIGPVEVLGARVGVKRETWSHGDTYRRLYIENGRLAGVVAIGEWAEVGRLQTAVNEGWRVLPWMLVRFRLVGRLWMEKEEDVAALPDTAIACNCTGVTCGQIRAAASEEGIPAIRRATGANTVCGSCGPLIEELLGAGGPPTPVRMWKPLLWFSGLAALAALVTLLVPRIPVPDTFGPSLWDKLWFDTIWKQWSGYILLGFTGVALLLGLRKRIRITRHLGGYDWWRIIHLGVGIGAAVVLFAHTGFRFGSNLNAMLMGFFCATMIFGAIAGLATGGEHRLREKGIGTAKKPPRGLPVWLHVLTIWPLPVLLILHILSVYAY